MRSQLALEKNYSSTDTDPSTSENLCSITDAEPATSLNLRIIGQWKNLEILKNLENFRDSYLKN